MDIPIRLKFFRKLELYQELKKLDKLVKRSDIFINRDWKVGKEVLKSEAQNLQFYPLSFDDLLLDAAMRVLPDRSEMKGNETQIDVARQVVDVLISRGYAMGKPGKMFFTPDGIWMGEVINDCESWWRKIRYPIFYWFVWITFISSGIILLWSGIKIIVNFVSWWLIPSLY